MDAENAKGRAESEASMVRSENEVLNTELEKRHTLLMQAQDQEEAKLEEIRAERDKAVSDHQFLIERQRQCEADAIQSKVAQSQAEDELNAKVEELADAVARAEILEANLEEANSSREGLAEKLSNAHQDAVSVRREIAEAKQQLKAAEEARMVSVSELKELKQKLAEIQAVADQKKLVDQKVKTLESQIDKLSAENQKLKRLIDKLREDNKRLSLEQKERSTPKLTSPQTPRSDLRGVGLVITDRPPHRIVSVVKGGPASEHGEICVDDHLLAIDDDEVEDQEISTVRSMLSLEL